MRVRSLFVWSMGSAAACAAMITGQRYRRWKQRLRQRFQTESCLLETSRGTVEYQMEGAGPVVLVLHGSPGGYDQGMVWAHLLAPGGSTLLSLSRPGYRRTPLNSGQAPEAQADLFAATLDALNVAQVVVIALSGGGPSALQLALRSPQRCRGLLLISPLAYASTEEEVYRSLPPGQRLQRWLFNHLLDWDPALYLLSALSKRMPQEAQASAFAAQSSAFIETLVMNSQHSSGYRNDMQQFATLPAYPFQDMVVPTLIVHGTADVDVPFRQTEALASALPHAQLVAIEGADHFSTVASERALAAIHHFLQSLPSGEALHVRGEKEPMEEE
ncbi:MAG TPA: alpha/beta hydrolase [Ktedonobacterales bacterium]|nr:alpha/beta hydrolase [Ktedonobacterales bacterium]